MTTMSTTPTHPGFPNILSDNVHGDYILVTCGSIVRNLFFSKLKNCTGKLGSVSCILKADNFWCSMARNKGTFQGWRSRSVA